MKKNKNRLPAIGLLVWSLLATGCFSENGPETGGPDPEPITPPDLQTVNFTVTYEAPGDTLFHHPGKWQEIHLLLASLDKSGKLIFHQSSPAGPMPQGYLGKFLSEADSVTANFQGKIIRNADSLVAYCYSPGLMPKNFAEHYAGRCYQVITAGCGGDTTRIAFTLKHQTAQMDLKLTNHTGQTIRLKRMKMLPVDQKSAPFYGYAVNYFSFAPSSYSATNTNDIYIPDISVAPGESYICRFSLFLTDEKALEGKAVNYIIQSEQGTYTYSRVGKIYLRGQCYTDEITIEGT